MGPVAGDPRFFARTGPHSLRRVAEAAGGNLDSDHADRLIHGVGPLAAAAPEHVSFIDNRRYVSVLKATRAGAVIMHPDLRDKVPDGVAAIVTPQPYVGWARVAALFHPAPAPTPGIHATALVDPSARVDPTAEIASFAVVGPGVVIGPGCRIDAHAVIGQGVVIGADCRIGTHATVSHALIGDRVTLLPGARVGQDGFGFAISGDNFVTVPQLGRVVLENDVEIGANTTIDRGSAQDTVIGAGSRLDNLVQIGHNVRLGRACVIVSQAGVSGSTVLDDFVQVGGQAGLTGHLHIGRAARLGAQAGIMSDVAAGVEVAGSPAMPLREFFRQIAVLRRLAARRPGRGVAADGTDSG